MSEEVRDRIHAVLKEAEAAAEMAGAFAYLPEIIATLKEMLAGEAMNANERRGLAGGLGRLATEDFDFSESQLGTTLLKLADEFASCGQ